MTIRHLLFFVAAAMQGGTIAYQFTACIDGRSLLNIQGDTISWRNLAFVVPGFHPSCPSANTATTITSSLDGTTVMNSVAWTPTWPSNSGNVDSSIFQNLVPSLPDSPALVVLTLLKGRGQVSINQMPSKSNGGKLVLDFDDNAPAFADVYSVRVDITPVPEPSSLVATLVALAAIGWFTTRRRSMFRWAVHSMIIIGTCSHLPAERITMICWDSSDCQSNRNRTYSPGPWSSELTLESPGQGFGRSFQYSVVSSDSISGKLAVSAEAESYGFVRSSTALVANVLPGK